MSAYQGVRNVSFLENFWNVLIEFDPETGSLLFHLGVPKPGQV